MFEQILDSIVVSIPACHAGDPGSIPGRGAFYYFFTFSLISYLPSYQETCEKYQVTFGPSLHFSTTQVVVNTF